MSTVLVDNRRDKIVPLAYTIIPYDYNALLEQWVIVYSISFHNIIYITTIQIGDPEDRGTGCGKLSTDKGKLSTASIKLSTAPPWPPLMLKNEPLSAWPPVCLKKASRIVFGPHMGISPFMTREGPKKRIQRKTKKAVQLSFSFSPASIKLFSR